MPFNSLYEIPKKELNAGFGGAVPGSGLSILFMRFIAILSPTAIETPPNFQFSLWDSGKILDVGSGDGLVYFQFSLWDSKAV